MATHLGAMGCSINSVRRTINNRSATSIVRRKWVEAEAHSPLAAASKSLRNVFTCQIIISLYKEPTWRLCPVLVAQPSNGHGTRDKTNLVHNAGRSVRWHGAISTCCLRSEGLSTLKLSQVSRVTIGIIFH